MQPKTSTLMTSLSALSKCLAAAGAFLAAPQIDNYAAPLIFDYLVTEYGYQIAYYGKWAFIGILVFATFFSITAILELLFKSSFKFGKSKGPM